MSRLPHNQLSHLNDHFEVSEILLEAFRAFTVIVLGGSQWCVAASTVARRPAPLHAFW